MIRPGCTEPTDDDAPGEGRILGVPRWIVERQGPMVVPAIVYLIALALFITDDHSKHGFPLDDAWIHRVYSESFSKGLGFQYNAGEQEAGLTSPAWAIFTAPAHWFGGPGESAVAIGVKTIGALFGLMAVLATSCALRHLTGSLLVATVGAALFALEPRLHFNSQSGMETILLIGLWAGATSSLVRNLLPRATVMIALMPTVRPEAIVVVPFFLLAVVLATDIRQRPRSTWSKLAAIAVTPSLLWGIFNQSVTGHWLPTTFYMKSTGFQFGGDQIATAWAAITHAGHASTTVFVVGLLLLIGWCVLVRDRRAVIVGAMLLAAPLVFAVSVVGSRNFMVGGFYWTRWTDPAALILTEASIVGLTILLVLGLREPRALVPPLGDRAPVVVRSAAGLVALVLLYAAPSLQQSFLERREQLSTDSRAIDIVNVQAGKWIAANTPADAVVGVNDAGATRYFGRRYTIDLVGLNDEEIAFGHKTLGRALSEAEWLVIFPSWFAARGALDYIDAEFEVREMIRIPLEEYTICECPGQTTNAILQRKVGR